MKKVLILKIMVCVFLLAGSVSADELKPTTLGWSGSFFIDYVQYQPRFDQKNIALGELNRTDNDGRSQIRYRFDDSDYGNSEASAKGILACLLAAQISGKKIRVFVETSTTIDTWNYYYISMVEVSSK